MPVELIGHRGARALFAENTLAGFQAALAIGVRSFEIDVGMTRDGVVVVSHDPFLSPDLTRQDDGLWLARRGPLLHRLDYAEVRTFDVGRLRPGSRTARRFPRQCALDGAAIPALEDVLRLHSRARWTIEIKTDPNRPRLTAPPEAIAEAVAEVADRTGTSRRIVVQSFDWRGPIHLRRLRPDLAYAWLTSRRTRAWRGGQSGLPDTVLAQGGGTWSPHHSELTRPLLMQAQAAGLRVAPWTVNQPDTIARLAHWGVDALITDDPQVARAVLSLAGPELPPHPEPN